MKIPDILLSGNFPEIEKWREQKAYEHTLARRPDLLEE
jgi:tRNA (guanine37-N1)-methyltransferase